MSGLAALAGTTSACAENTGARPCMPRDRRNYLRVRGEYLTLGIDGSAKAELPPRARRIPKEIPDADWFDGTTSACAENTESQAGGYCAWGNYLRVRGEYLATRVQNALYWELPPRARRILQTLPLHHMNIGTTSACAENT